MTEFTPISATLGGMLIGIAAVILMAFNGRIAGISGIFSGAVLGNNGGRSWQLLFLLGLITAPVIYSFVSAKPIAFDMTASWPLIIVGGLLVGFGTRLGSGCTSGHGVCGLSRLSLRSMVAVAIFMVAGIATVTIIRTVLG